MTPRACAALAAVLSPAAGAAEVRSVEVVHERDEFRVTIEAVLDAPPGLVFSILSDPALWPRVNELVKQTEVIGRGPLVRSVSEGCVLGFCKRIEQVQRLWIGEDWSMRADTLPGGDLRSGWAVTRVSAHGDGALFHYEMALEPDFWVPPLVGPWILKRKLGKQAVETAVAVEAVARALR